MEVLMKILKNEGMETSVSHWALRQKLRTGSVEMRQAIAMLAEVFHEGEPWTGDACGGLLISCLDKNNCCRKKTNTL